MSRARMTKLELASVVEVGIAAIFIERHPNTHECPGMWRFSTESRSEPAQKCTIVPRNSLSSVGYAPISAETLCGRARASAQREDEYGLRARSETTSNSARSTKFITTEEPP